MSSCDNNDRRRRRKRERQARRHAKQHRRQQQRAAARSAPATRLTAWLSSLPPLRGHQLCTHMLERCAARVREQGGEYLQVIIATDRGPEFVMLATHNPCLEPATCGSDHRAPPRSVATIAALAAAARPEHLRVSLGWAEKVATLTGKGAAP
jgi:hypothetical protein